MRGGRRRADGRARGCASALGLALWSVASGAAGQELETSWCDFTCPAEGLLEGSAPITGDAGVDLLFARILEHLGTAQAHAAALDRDLSYLAESAELAAEDATPTEQLAELFAAAVDAGAGFEATTPSCWLDAAAATEVLAACSRAPSFAPPRCTGRCECVGDAAECTPGDGERCRGRCDGELEPGSASPVCYGIAVAVANMGAHCSPAPLTWTAEGADALDADARARIQRTAPGLAFVIARGQRALRLLTAAETLESLAADAAEAHLAEAVEDANVGEAVNLACALYELQNVSAALAVGTTDLRAALADVTRVLEAAGLGDLGTP